MTNEELMNQFRETMPPVFAAAKLEYYTGGALLWATLQNRRINKKLPSKEVPPKSCFKYDGMRKVLVVRDELLKWWEQIIVDEPVKRG